VASTTVTGICTVPVVVRFNAPVDVPGLALGWVIVTVMLTTPFAGMLPTDWLTLIQETVGVMENDGIA
jgi:hypothetical protein